MIMSYDLATLFISFMQSLFIKKGGTIFDNCKVTAIHPGDTVTLETNKGNYRARKIVITAGLLKLKCNTIYIQGM